MKDMLALIYWLDNSKSSLIEASLANERIYNKEKALILKALAEEKQDGERSGKKSPIKH